MDPRQASPGHGQQPQRAHAAHGTHAAHAPHPPWLAQRPPAPTNPLGLDEKSVGSLAHLCFFIFPVVGPIAIALTSARGSASRQMASHAAAVQGLTYVAMFGLYVAAMIGMIVFVGVAGERSAERVGPMLGLLPLLVTAVTWVLGLWGSVAGAIAANRGIVWRLPIVGRLAESVLA